MWRIGLIRHHHLFSDRKVWIALICAGPEGVDLASQGWQQVDSGMFLSPFHQFAIPFGSLVTRDELCHAEWHYSLGDLPSAFAVCMKDGNTFSKLLSVLSWPLPNPSGGIGGFTNDGAGCGFACIWPLELWTARLCSTGYWSSLVCFLSSREVGMIPSSWIVGWDKKIIPLLLKFGIQLILAAHQWIR